MNIWHAIILGIIQGATEFLPVSSSAHLAIAAQCHLGGIHADMAFFLILHAGTLIAVLIGTRKTLYEILTTQRSLLIPISIATICTAVIAIPLQKMIEKSFDSTIIIGCGLLCTTLIIIIGDRISRKKKATKEIVTTRMGIFIGTLQGITPFPGISRSGTTISAGLLSGLTREAAVRFSFLLAIPAIGGALLLDFKDISSIQAGYTAAILGFFSAFASGYLALKLLLKLISTKYYVYFAGYTLILSIVLITYSIITR